MINIFIGYDTKEEVSYHVLSQSILKNSTSPVSITPIYLNNIRKYFWRERSNLESTEFSFSRFLVPFLMGYEGWALFMDCDMLMQADITELWEMRRDQYAVQVCKHDYTPKNDSKFLNQTQTKYEKKNWSSFMLMNCEKCKALTPKFVNTATGLELHQFKWLESEDLIGDIPLEWNWLVGEYDVIDHPKNLHYTLGGPWFDDFKNCDYSDEWSSTARELTAFYDDSINIT